MKRSFIREILEHTNSNTISFAGGLPNESLFPYKELQTSAYEILNNPKVLQYSTSTGYKPLKEQIAKIYTENGFETKSENIMITSGSQQALDIICRYYTKESITIESPSYLGAMNLFKLNQMTTNAIELGSEGIDILNFEQSLAKSKLAYLIPDFQNPTGTTYSLEHREKIAKIFQKNKRILIEDSPYSELYFNTPPRSISSFLPKQSFHLGSFSKVLAPALRIGWIRADSSLLQPLIAYKEAMDLHTSSITQQMVSDYLRDEKMFQTHLHKLRKAYKEKMLYFSKILDAHLPKFSHKKPKGGMFIYGKIEGINSMELVQLAMKNGVVFVPGSEFGGADDEIRFNFTHSTFKEIEEGIKRIAKSLKDY